MSAYDDTRAMLEGASIGYDTTMATPGSNEGMVGGSVIMKVQNQNQPHPGSGTPAACVEFVFGPDGTLLAVWPVT